MIKVRLYGNLGNQMFQYAFGYLVSQKLKTPFIMDSYYVNYSLKYFRLSFPYYLICSSLVVKVYNKIQGLVKFKKVIDCNDLLKDYTTYSIQNHAYYLGYFQDASLYTENRNAVKKLFELKSKYIKRFEAKYGSYFSPGKKVVTVSVRLGDYKHLYIKELNDTPVLLPISWYKKQLESEVDENCILFVISDNVEEAKQELNLDHHETIYVRDHMINQFQLLLNSDICIIANSTFAWWGGFLNDKPGSRVIAPLNWAGYNSSQEYPKGIMNVPFEWKA